MFGFHTRSGLAAVILTVLVGPGADGQVREVEPTDEVAVTLELARPFLTDIEVDFLTLTFMPTLRLPVGERSTLFAQWGVAQARVEGENSATLSNPRIGITFGGTEATYGLLAVTLPLATEIGEDDFATGVGLLSDFERPETFVPDIMAVEGAVAPRKALGSGATVGGRLGAALLIPTDDAIVDDSELFIRVGAHGDIPAGATRIGAELSSSILVSDSDLEFGRRASNQLTLSVAMPDTGGAPEFYLRLPVDGDFNDIVRLVFGARVTL